MKIFLFISLVILCIQCKNVQTFENIVLIAEEPIEKGPVTETYARLQLFKDSSYLLTVNYKNPNYEKDERFIGGYVRNGDTIAFKTEIDFFHADKGVIKNNFFEFINGAFPLKFKVIYSSQKMTYDRDTTKFKDYSVFELNYEYFDSSYYAWSIDAERPSLENFQPYCLKDSELQIVDSILRICIKESNGDLQEINTYYKQCIGVINSSNEIEVWLNCSCKGNEPDNEFQFSLVNVSDGGNCFFKLKINLTRKKYYDLYINGYA